MEKRKKTRKRLTPKVAMKRVLCTVLSLAMVLSGMIYIPEDKGEVKAAVSYKSDEVALPTSPGSYLIGGRAYVVKENTTITATTAGTSALYTEVNGGKSSVIIYIPKGVTLTVKGADGNGRTGGGAGIYVPSDNPNTTDVNERVTLIVTGQGKLVATGGKGGSAGNGSNGDNASSKYHAGNGGKGGNGAGGAGAGIGTSGGTGGAETTGGTGYDGSGGGDDNDEGSGTSGQNGNNGSNASRPGNVYIIGSVDVEATGGAAGQGPTVTSFSNGSDASQEGSWTAGRDHQYACGGKAGQSGAATNAAAGIGSGAPGGRSGYSGGGGGTGDSSPVTGSFNTARNNAYNNCGASGSSGSNGAGSAACEYVTGKDATVSKNQGSVQEMSTTSWGTKATGRTIALDSAEYRGLYSETIISFYDDLDGATPDKKVYAMYGAILPEFSRTITIPQRPGYTFMGYYTEKYTDPTKADPNKMVFDQEGKLLEDKYLQYGSWITPTNIEVYALWSKDYYYIAYNDREWSNDARDQYGSYNGTYVRLGKLRTVQYGNFMAATADEAGINEEEHPNFKFVGWSKDPKATEPDYKPGQQYKGTLATGNDNDKIVNLYAIYKKVDGYTISYSGNGNDIAPAYHIPSTDIVKKNDQGKYLYSIPEEYVPDRKGYTFKGWAEEAIETDVEKIYLNGTNDIEITKDTVFYAQWEKNPVVTYDLNGGSFKKDVNEEVKETLNKKDYEAGKIVNTTSLGAAQIAKKGYTFKGWRASTTVGGETRYLRIDGTLCEWVASEAHATVFTDSVSFPMPAKDVIVSAVWTQDKFDVNLNFKIDESEGAHQVTTIENGFVYKFKALYRYSTEDKGTTTEYGYETGTGAERILLGATVADKKNLDYKSAALDADGIPYGGDIKLVVTLNTTFDSDTMVVKVGDTVYKPSETDVDEDGCPTYTYIISNITSNINATVTNSKQYVYDINYVDPSEMVKSNLVTATGFDKYYAGVEKTLPTGTDMTVPQNYSFVGWYEDEATANSVTNGNKGSYVGATPVTKIEAKTKGNTAKTYYAAWQGKTYTVNYYYSNYDSKDGTRKTSDVVQTTERYGTQFTVGRNLDGQPVPYVVGPNGAAFIGWAKSPNATKPDYTPGESVKDLPVSGTSVNLYAVWDISKVKVTFDANGGKFNGGDVYKTYEVSYKLSNGGAYTATNIASYSSSMQRGDSGDSGYTFKGWATTPDATEPNVTGISTGTIYENTTFYAVWGKGEVIVTYYSDLAGTENENVKQYKYPAGSTIKLGIHEGQQVVKAPENKTLVGWSIVKNTPNMKYVQGESFIVGDKASFLLYPIFENTSTYKLVYDVNGGTWRGSTIVTIGTKIIGQNETVVRYVLDDTIIPERVGYDFVGWVDSEDSNVVYKPGVTYEAVDPDYLVSLVAKWKPHVYSLGFYPGNAVKVDAKYKNAKDLENVVPVRMTTLADGAKAVENDSTAYTQDFAYDAVNQSILPYQFVYNGFKFVGWTENPNDVNPVIAFTDKQVISNLTSEKGLYKNLYGVWRVDTPITVSYNANGGKGKVPEQDLYVNTISPTTETIDIELETPDTTSPEGLRREGYKFIGWTTFPLTLPQDFGDGIVDFVKEYFVVDKDSISTSTTYYAVWREYKTYRVEYDFNGGKGQVPVDNNLYCADGKSYDGNKVTVKFDPKPTRDGYEFQGWTDSVETGSVESGAAEAAVYTEPEGTNPAPTFTIKKNTTLSAIWEPETYSIEYYDYVKDGNEWVEKALTTGEGDKVKNLVTPAVYDKAVKLDDGSSSNPNKGYKFVGWANKPGGTVVYDGGSQVKNLTTDKNGVVKLYAVYGPKTYRIVLDDDVETYTTYLVDYKRNHFKQTTVVGTSEEREYERVYMNDVEVETYDTTNKYPTYEIQFGQSLKDINLPSVYGFDFGGYVLEGNSKVKGYNSSGNVVRVLDEDLIGDDKAKQDKNGVAEVVLKAVWEPHDFEVEFVQDGKKIDAVATKYGQPFTMPHTVRNLAYTNDYTVVGWTTDVNKQYLSTTEEIEETINADNGFILNKKYPADKVARLYNNDKANVTLYPVYKTTVEYKVRFVADGATNVPETQIVPWMDNFVVDFETVIMKTPKKTGYTFLGWSTKEDFEDGDSSTVTYPYPVNPDKDYVIKNIGDNITLYAEFKANNYTITYRDGDKDVVAEKDVATITYPFLAGGESGDAYTFKSADEVSFAAPTGYKLLGWSLEKGANANAVDFYPGQTLDRALATAEGTNITLYAVWVATDYVINFDKNNSDAKGAMNTQTMTYDKAAALDKNQYVADGYEFLGWSKDAKASKPEYTDGLSVGAVDSEDGISAYAKSEEVAGNVKLYAIWKPVIESKDDEITYDGKAYDATSLFVIPKNAGVESYSIEEADGATLGDDNKITFTKAGKYTVDVKTAEAAGVAAAEAKATVTVKKAKASGTLAVYVGDTAKKNVPYEDASKVVYKVTLDTPVAETGSPEIEYTYKVATESDTTYKTGVPTKSGDYKVKAVVADTDLYEGFVATTDYTVDNNLFDKVKTTFDETTQAEIVGTSMVDNGATKTVAGLNLPSKVTILLKDGAETKADVTWDVKGIKDSQYKRSIQDKDQTFLTNGVVTLPDDVSSDLSKDELAEALKVKIKVIVLSDINGWKDSPDANLVKDALENDVLANEDVAALNAKKDDYDYAEKREIDSLELEAAKAIATLDPEDPEYETQKADIIADLLSDLDKVPTSAEKYQQLVEEAKEALNKRLKDVYDTLATSGSYTKQAEELAAAYVDGKKVIDALDNVDDAEKVLSEAKAILAAVNTDAEVADIEKAEAESQAAEESVVEAAADIEEALKDAEETIAANDKDEYVDPTDNDAIKEAVKAVEAAKEELSKLPKNASNADKLAAAAVVDDALYDLWEAIYDARWNANNKKAEAEEKAKKLEEAKADAIKRLGDFVDNKNVDRIYRADQKDEIAKLQKDAEDAINAAKTSDEIATALKNVKDAVNAVKTNAELTKEEKDAADTEAANKVADAISKLPAGDKIGTADKSAIESARKAYGELTEAQKAKVSAETLNTLTTAETSLAAAEKVAAEKAAAEKAAAEKAAAEKAAADKAAAEKAAAEKAAADKAAAEKAAAAKKAAQALANKIAINSKLKVSQSGKKIKVVWGAVKGATSYKVYVQYCGKKFGKAVKTVKSAKGVSITKLRGKKISLKKNFKVYVAAYKGKTRLAKTITAHVVGRKNTKYSNVKSITLKTPTATLNVGGTTKISAKTVLVSKKKKNLSNAHAKKFRYSSDNKAVATVDGSGNIKAVAKGTCKVYVYARNGYAKTVTVTVQ
ncbi:InlB B-repeat-containing protein [Eubacterium xylanophilum]|uniref:InlB B-repeat-containing protein n=1 Tax=Eubacterium xylanophilum TaxID=39497 RepID=UPI0004B043EF|nr:InlB B-repeat-containing protein [Eubacterium xylanophilum]